MDKDAILFWVKSYEGVTDEMCPDFDSLREGHAIAIIFNQLNDDVKIDLSTLQNIDRTKDDWFNCLKNLKCIAGIIKDPFAAVKLTSPIDVTGIARKSKPDALTNLISWLILYSLKGPKKDESVQRVKNLPKETQAAIKEIIKTQATKSPTKPAVPSSPTAGSISASSSTAESPTLKAQPSLESLEVKTQRIKLENQLKQLENEKNQLLSENSDLKNEKQKLNEQKAAQSPSNASNLADIEKLKELTQKKEEAEKLSQQLDEDLAKLEPIREQKTKMQAELDAVNARLRNLKQKLNQAAPTIDGFRDSTDPTAIKLLQEIDEAEKLIQPETTNKLNQELNKFKKAILQIAADIKQAKELIGDAPENEDDLSTQLSNEIDALTEKNNAANEEILALIAKAEAIEKMKNQHSFLEHIRSSSIFLKPE